MQEFDPSKPVVSEVDGLEYASLADLIVGTPVWCERNNVIEAFRRRADIAKEDWVERVAWQYRYQSRDGIARSADSKRWIYPQLPESIAQYIRSDHCYHAGSSRAA